MENLAKRLAQLHTEIMERSIKLWPEQKDRWRGLKLNTKQYLHKLEANDGERLSRAKLPTLIDLIDAIEKEEKRRISNPKC